ncbi:MAG: nucleotidyltransferase [Victivallales bacterium]|nr:nucleotidyltransferase [Victivallales bacterium]
MTALETTLLKIAELFHANSIPYMLIGGYSMALHGCPRLTQDLDITLGLDVDGFNRIMQVLDSDFKTLTSNPKEFAEKTNVLLIEDKETTIRCDLIFSFIDFERQAIKDADNVEINGVQIKNASIENLMIYKILSGRERDKEDAETLLRTHINTIDLNYVTDAISELSMILENNSHNVWEIILAKMPR